MKAVVIVSGAPGAGKTTLAVPLAAELGFPLLSKDAIKETLFDSIVPASEVDPMSWSKQLGGASMELIWTLAERFPQVVLEANFRPHSSYERTRLIGLGGRLVEVNCVCPPELAAERYSRRARSGTHHATHVLPDLSDELLAEFDAPMAIGPLIQVDTRTSVDVMDLATDVLALLRSSP